MGYDDTKVVEARNFVRAISGEPVELATLDDAVASAAVLDAMVASQETGQWVSL
jgi:predicted dehydrogenase